jgi:hypothetical protein
MPMRVVSGRFKPMRVELHTGILRLRVSMDDILFQGEEDVLNMRETAFANSVLFFEASFELQPFVNLKRKPRLQYPILKLQCMMVLYLHLLIVFLLHRELLKLILVDEPLPEVVLSQSLPFFIDFES